MNILKEIERLKQSQISEIITNRIKEFEILGKKHEDEVFSELCFCLMTANFSADKCIKIQKEMGRNILILPEKELAKELTRLGHRFPNARANYISEARKCKSELFKIMNPDSKQMREWLVQNIKGLGMKEASHFLRNIGYKDLAIIDFHIMDLLAKESLINKPKSKSLTKKQYLEIEKVLENLGKEASLNLAELDLYLWYIETGKILK